MIATPFCLQRADAIEEPLDLPIGERGGRLVHHQDPGVLRQRLGDLDHLLLRHAELVRQRARVDVEAEAVEQTARVGVHLPVVDRLRASVRGLAAEKDVLREVRGTERARTPGR